MDKSKSEPLLVLYDDATEEQWVELMTELDGLWEIAQEGKLTPEQVDRIIQLARLDWLAEDDETWHPEVTKVLEEIYRRR